MYTLRFIDPVIGFVLPVCVKTIIIYFYPAST